MAAADDSATIADELAAATSILSAAGIGSARLDAALLLAYVTGVDRAMLWARSERSLEPEHAALFHELVQRRAERVPLPYLTGTAEFWSLEFVVEPAVLCPRPETEGLVEAVLERCGVDDRVADVGTGSGCVAVALATERPQLRVVAVDRSIDAARIATRNVHRHAAGQVQVIVGDLTGPLGGGFDIVVSNPPYVSLDEAHTVDHEVRHEPHMAVYAPAAPEALYAQLAVGAARVTRRGGSLVLELSETRAGQIAEAVAATGSWAVDEVRDDLAGHPRVLLATRR